MIELNFSPQIDDYLAAYRAHHQRNWSTWASLGFTALALLFQIFDALRGEPGQILQRAGLSLLVLVFCLAIAVYAFVISPARVKRLLASDPRATSPVQVRVDANGLHTNTEFAQNENPWQNFSSLIDTPQLFMLLGHERRASFQVLPKRAFNSSADLEAFQALVSEHLPKPKGRNWDLRAMARYFVLLLSLIAALVLFLRLIGLLHF